MKNGAVCLLFTLALCALFPGTCQPAEGPPPLEPVVEVEEEVYRYEPANNGATPTWCYGSTCLVRIGEKLFASGIEKLPDFVPLNNCRWLLFERGANGWQRVAVDEKGRTREPSPLVGFSDGRLFLSAHPTLDTDPTEYDERSQSIVLQFSAASPKEPFETILPDWDGTPHFRAHSYRSFAADSPNRELILFVNIDYTHAEWAFRDSSGQWAAKGKLIWPWGAEYDKPQPIRVCYPNVALKGRAVHFCGVSDIVEPYNEWRTYKKELTGREWDYDFRRLFYTWSPDITTGEFRKWVEVASRDKTDGWIFPSDLWVAPDGAAHIIWQEHAIDERLRDKFFPDALQSYALNYAVIREGEVAIRRSLMLSEEGKSQEIPGRCRFQVTHENRLFVFYYVSGTDTAGEAVSENRVLEIHSDGSIGQAVSVPMQHPFGSFFTATVRAGSPPSKVLELLGTQVGVHTVNYARVRLHE